MSHGPRQGAAESGRSRPGPAKEVDQRRLRGAAAGCALKPLRIAIEEAAEGELEIDAIDEGMKAHRSTRG